MKAWWQYWHSLSLTAGILLLLDEPGVVPWISVILLGWAQWPRSFAQQRAGSWINLAISMNVSLDRKRQDVRILHVLHGRMA